MTNSPALLPLETASAGLACDLDALTPAQREQQAATAEQLRRLVLGVEELPDGWALRLPTSDDTLQLVAAFIANERVCCPFFEFTLNVTAEAGPTWLRLTGQPGVKEFLAGAFADRPAVSSDQRRSPSGRVFAQHSFGADPPGNGRLSDALANFDRQLSGDSHD
jgi:hypothetical protein